MSDGPAGWGLEPNLSLVMVVASSQINKIVVARIAERMGLKAAMEAPGGAGAALARLRPAVVILDGGANNLECDGLFPHIASFRQLLPTALPKVILLSTRNVRVEDIAHSTMIDAVVAKPITPDNLQPVIHRLVSAMRG